jgi:tRNA(Ile)-lysidine synthase
MPEQSLTFSSLEQVLAPGMEAKCWYVAFSGGLDSTVLLHLLRSLSQSKTSAPELIAWHVNHGMQAQSDDWETHCAAVCDALDIPLKVDRIAVQSRGQGAESAARDARYQIFEQGVLEGDILMMAHHLDDQVETFFLRLMRGAGLQGLSGMPGERRLGEGLLLRPLLEVPRESLLEYARQHDLSWIEDPSNKDVSMDRNLLRLEILPLLAQRWPGYRQTVTRASGHVASALMTLEDNVPEPVTVYSTLGDPGVPMQVLTEGAADVAAIRLRSWLRSLGLPMPGRSLLEEFLRQLRAAGAGSSPRLDCGSYTLQRYRDAVYLLPDFSTQDADRSCQLAAGGSANVDGVGQLSLISASAEGLALSPGELVDIAWCRGGERCRPQGRAHSQTLKKLFQERAVPTWWRARVPLVLVDGEIVCVGDLWLCTSAHLRRPGKGVGDLWQLRWDRNTFAAVD